MSKLSKIVLEPGESKIDTWDLFYNLPDGSKFMGTLMATNKRIFFDAKAEGTVAGLVKSTSAFAPNSLGIFEISKDRVTKVEVENSFFSKRAVGTLDNGEKHVFDRRMMSADKVAEAIRQK